MSFDGTVQTNTPRPPLLHKLILVLRNQNLGISFHNKMKVSMNYNQKKNRSLTFRSSCATCTSKSTVPNFAGYLAQRAHTAPTRGSQARILGTGMPTWVFVPSRDTSWAVIPAFRTTETESSVPNNIYDTHRMKYKKKLYFYQERECPILQNDSPRGPQHSHALRIVVKNPLRELPLGAVPCFQKISSPNFFHRLHVKEIKYQDSNLDFWSWNFFKTRRSTWVARSVDFSQQFWVREFVEDPQEYCSCAYERLLYLSILKTYGIGRSTIP